MLLFPGIKMKVEYCTLTNATFENNIRHTFKRLKEEELHFDMSIYCSGQIMQAHKIVVSASSGFFSEVLSHISHSKPLIVLNHMSPSLITNMLNFICHGEICLSTKEKTSFLEAAVELKIVGLSQVHASEDDVLSQTESGENQLKQENEEIFDESEDREYDAEQSEREGILSKSSTKSLLLSAPEKVCKNLQW